MKAQDEKSDTRLAAGLVVWEWDLGDHIDVSPDRLVAFGIDPGSLFGQRPETLLEFVHPEDRVLLEAEFRSAIAGGRAISQEIRVTPPDGRPRRLHVRMKPIADASGRSVRVAGAIEDITESHAAHLALSEAETRLRQITESITEVFWLWDADTGEDLYISPAFDQVFGRPRDTVFGGKGSWLNLLHPEDRERLAGRYDALHRPGPARDKPWRAEYRVIHPDGSVHWVRDQVFGVRNAAGEVHRFAAVMEDITAQQAAEAAAREVEGRFETLAESLDDALIAIEGNSEIVYWNRKATEMFGYRVAEAIGMPVTSLMRGPERERHLQALARLARGERPRLLAHGPLQFVARHKDGHEFPIELTLGSYVAASRRYYTGVVRDITRRTSVEHELARGAEERRGLIADLVDAHDEERRRVAAEIHDDSIQTLSALALRLDALLTGTATALDGGVVAQITAEIRSAITRLRRLTFALRPPTLESEGLAAAVREQVQILAHEKGLRYRVRSRLAREPTPVTSELAYHAAREALVNVARHAGAQCIAVSISGSDGGVTLRIRDDGVGFAPPSVKNGAPEHMGLATIRQNVARAGGHLSVDSAPGAGTVVELAIPPLAGHERITVESA